MKVLIKNFQSHLIEEYGNETSSTYFGITETHYIYKFDRLIVKIGHYRDVKQEYQLIFDDVVSCKITEESYSHTHEKESYEGFAFLWQIRNSKFKEDLIVNSIFQTLHGVEKSNSLKSYRIIGQNNFIDVLTAEEPIIEIVGTDL